MEETINLKEIFSILKKRWKLIISLTLIIGTLSGVISYFLLTPVYEASTQILVNQKNSENQIDIAQLNSNVSLIETYSVIIKSPTILDKVIKNLNLDISLEELNENITVNSQNNSQVFSVTVRDHNLSEAVRIANTVTETFQTDIQGIMNVDNVSILAKAQLIENTPPIQPKPLLNIAIAVIIGFMLGIGLALLSEYLDNTLKDSQNIELYLGLPVLGVIPEITKQKKIKSQQINKTGVESRGSEV